MQAQLFGDVTVIQYIIHQYGVIDLMRGHYFSQRQEMWGSLMVMVLLASLLEIFSASGK